MKAAPVAAHEIGGARAVAGLLGDEKYGEEAAQVRALPPHLDLDDGEIIDFLYRVGIERVGGGGRTKVFSVEDLGKLAWSAHELFSMGLSACEDWPTAFYEVLDAIASRISRSGPRRVVVMAVVRWLDGLQDGHGAAIRAAVAAYRQGVDESSECQPTRWRVLRVRARSPANVVNCPTKCQRVSGWLVQ